MRDCPCKLPRERRAATRGSAASRRRFPSQIRQKSLADLEPRLERARSSLVAAFANGVAKDRTAVSAAISLPWSNGQTEGQIAKLKLVKRQIYGRGKIDLLQARVIGAG